MKFDEGTIISQQELPISPQSGLLQCKKCTQGAIFEETLVADLFHKRQLTNNIQFVTPMFYSCCYSVMRYQQRKVYSSNEYHNMLESCEIKYDKRSNSFAYKAEETILGYKFYLFSQNLSAPKNSLVLTLRNHSTQIQ